MKSMSSSEEDPVVERRPELKQKKRKGKRKTKTEPTEKEQDINLELEDQTQEEIEKELTEFVNSETDKIWEALQCKICNNQQTTKSSTRKWAWTTRG